MSPEDIYISYLSKSEEKLQKALSRLELGQSDSFLEIEQQFYLIKKSEIAEVEKRVFDIPPSVSFSCNSTVLQQVIDLAKQSGISLLIRNQEEGQFALLLKKEKAILSVKQHAQCLEILKKVADLNGFIPLFHEKPFANMPVSDTTFKWSLNHHLFSFPESPSNLFFILMTAMVHAVYKHQDFLYEIATCARLDPRLFASELLTYPLHFSLGKLNEFFNVQESKEFEPSAPFCTYVGDGFVFRGFGSNSHPALNLCMIQSAYVDSLVLIIDEIQTKEVREVLKKHMEESTTVWKEEGKRDTTHLDKHLFVSFLSPKTIRATASIIGEEELAILQKKCFVNYVEMNKATISSMTKYFALHILPKLSGDWEMKVRIEQAIASLDEIEKMALGLGPEIQAKMYSEIAIPRMQKAKSSM